MPYFSFSLKNIPPNKIINFNDYISITISPNTNYYSKNTSLWQILNKKYLEKYLNFIKREKRIKAKKKYGKSILFCLPPSIGLGDAVEYALAIKAIEKSQQYKKVGISFVGRYKKIFTKYFDINNVYDHLISQNEIDSYEVTFHVTHEIEELVMQKYDRQDIEKLLTE